MKSFHQPLASETIKEVLFKALPILGITIPNEHIELIKNHYDAHKLFEVRLLLVQHRDDENSEIELLSSIEDILTKK